MTSSQRRIHERKKLPHEIPSWVKDDARYFITVNCKERGRDQLCAGGVARRLTESVIVYERLGYWCTWLIVVMPDHLHLIVSFDIERGIQSVVGSWKRYHARISGIVWQTGFFEHRLRNDAEFDEKMSYVLMNPVRRRLVSDPDEWPHRWERQNGS